jgi:hypothetical protein
MNRDELVRRVCDVLGGPYVDVAEPAINLILEEAARLAESLWVSTGLEGIERESGGHEVAAAIRALKGGSQ